MQDNSLREHSFYSTKVEANAKHWEKESNILYKSTEIVKPSNLGATFNMI
jgi:hypothetical protein